MPRLAGGPIFPRFFLAYYVESKDLYVFLSTQVCYNKLLVHIQYRRLVHHTSSSTAVSAAASAAIAFRPSLAVGSGVGDEDERVGEVAACEVCPT